MSIFNSFGCCIVWFLIGLLLGWLLNKLLRCFCKSKCCANGTTKSCCDSVDANANDSHGNNVNTLADTKTKPATTAEVKPVTQAAVTTTAIDITAAKAAGFSLKNANDLTVVEGIGPKINELFHNAGIKTFSALSTQTVSQMRAILDAGGARFRIANPSTWAQQATLANENKWAALKKLQDELSGGIKK